MTTEFIYCERCTYLAPKHADDCALNPKNTGTPQTPSRDWPGDSMEYECVCCQCGARFKGHKNRVTCRQCAQPYAA